LTLGWTLAGLPFLPASRKTRAAAAKSVLLPLVQLKRYALSIAISSATSFSTGLATLTELGPATKGERVDLRFVSLLGVTFMNETARVAVAYRSRKYSFAYLAPGSATRVFSRSSSIRFWFIRSLVELPDVAAAAALARYHEMSVSSTGKSPTHTN
jgi:hypothetical protein